MTFILAVFVLFALAAVAFFVWLTKPRIRDDAPTKKPDAIKRLNDLFLRVTFSPHKNLQQAHDGYLRSLTLSRATLVANANGFKKGETLDLVLDSGEESHIPCRIVGARPLGDSYVIDVRFINPDRATTNVVRNYMRKTLEPVSHKNYADGLESQLH